MASLAQFERALISERVKAGLARWAGSGGRYRTVQRFFSTVIPWATLFWVFFRQHVYCPEDVYLLVGDEVVATKAGTYGLGTFLLTGHILAPIYDTRKPLFLHGRQSAQNSSILAWDAHTLDRREEM